MKRNLKMKTIALAVAGGALFASCSAGMTKYEIQYCFDNTEMNSDFLQVYELTNEGANGKWRSNRHHLDTFYVDGKRVEWASGTISEVARENCVALQVLTCGYRQDGGGNYTLDTIFRLEEGEKNFIFITPDHKWKDQY